MENRVTSNIIIENARIGFRNFSGKESRYNPAGRKNFCVFLDNELAVKLQNDGWNVRWLTPKDEGDPDQGYLQVAVSYDHIPPKVMMITGRGQTRLDDESVNALDWAEIEEVDLIIRPYNWIIQPGTKNEKRGVKAYLKTMYVKIVEDAFEKKWANSPIANEEEDM